MFIWGERSPQGPLTSNGQSSRRKIKIDSSWNPRKNKISITRWGEGENFKKAAEMPLTGIKNCYSILGSKEQCSGLKHKKEQMGSNISRVW